MNRIAKFRGRVIHDYIEHPTGSWVYGNLEWPTDARIDFAPVIIEWTNDGMRYVYEVDPDTVGESTGLEDKYGKEIFEGDIFEMTAHPRIYTRIVGEDGSYNGETYKIHPGVLIRFVVEWSLQRACFDAKTIYVDPIGVIVGSTFISQDEIAVGDVYLLHNYFNEHNSEEIIGNIYEDINIGQI